MGREERKIQILKAAVRVFFSRALNGPGSRRSPGPQGSVRERSMNIFQASSSFLMKRCYLPRIFLFKR